VKMIAGSKAELDCSYMQFNNPPRKIKII